MNKIFRSVWNAKLGVFVAAGENAKTQTKGKSLKAKIVTGLVAGASLLYGGLAGAAYFYDANGYLYTTETYNAVDATESNIAFGTNALGDEGLYLFSGVDFSSNLSTETIISHDASLQYMGDYETPYFNTGIDGYQFGLIQLSAELINANLTLNGLITQTGSYDGVNNDQIDSSAYFFRALTVGEDWGTGRFDTSGSDITNNALITTNLNYSNEETDLSMTFLNDYEQFVGSTTIQIADLEDSSTFTNNGTILTNASLTSDLTFVSTNDSSGYNYDMNSAGSEVGEDVTDWVDGYDYANQYNLSSNENTGVSIDDVINSTVVNNGLVSINADTTMSVDLDFNNFSVDYWEDFGSTGGDIEEIDVADIYQNDWFVFGNSVGYDTGVLFESSLTNNDTILVDDTASLNFNAIIGYQQLATSSLPVGTVDSATRIDDDYLTSFNDNNFDVISIARGIINVGEIHYDSTVTNNGTISANSHADASIVVTQDGGASIGEDNSVRVNSIAGGVNVAYDYFTSGLAIDNSGDIFATATTDLHLNIDEYMFEGRSFVGGDYGYDGFFVSAEASGISLNHESIDFDSYNRFDILLGGGEDTRLYTSWVPYYALWAGTYDGGYVFDSLVTNSGTVNAIATLNTSQGYFTDAPLWEPGEDNGPRGNLYAQAIGVDMLGVSIVGGINSDDEIISNNVGLNNTGTINAIATASQHGDAVSIGYVWGEDFLDQSSETRDIYVFQNSGTITSTAMAALDQATAFGTAGEESELQWHNEGVMTISAISGEDNATAYGAFWDSDIFNTVTNDGVMTVNATTSEYFTTAAAYGFFFGDEIDANSTETGMLVNNGVITVSAVTEEEARYTDTIAIGVEQENQEGIFENTGQLRTYATNGEDSVSVGLRAINIEGSMTGDAAVDYDQTNYGYINNAGLIASYSTHSQDDNSRAYDESRSILTAAMQFTSQIFAEGLSGEDGRIDNSGVLLGSSVYDGEGYDISPNQETYGIFVEGYLDRSIINNSGTVRAYNYTNADDLYNIYNGAADYSELFVASRGLSIDSMYSGTDGETILWSQVNNNIGGYIGALADGYPMGQGEDFFESYNDGYYVVGLEVDHLEGQINNGEITRPPEYYNSTVEGFLDFDISTLTDEYNSEGFESINGYTAEEIASLINTGEDLYYNLESHNRLVSGSQTGRDNYAFIDQEITDGLTTGLRYNLAFKNYLADNDMYGDGAYSVVVDYNEMNYSADITGEINNYCYGVFEGAAYIGQTDLDFYNAGRINTRINETYIASNFEQTNTGILQIAIQDSTQPLVDIDYGTFVFDNSNPDGFVTFSDTTNIRVSVRDSNAGLSTGDLDGAGFNGVLQDLQTSNLWSNTNLVVQDNRLDVNFVAFDDDVEVDLESYATGLTTLEDAAARPTKNLGWLLDDYNLLHDADYQTRELNAYLYALGSSENRSEVNAQLHKALPLLAGGNTLSNIQLLNDTRNNIEDRLVSRLDKRVGDVYQGKKNAWFRAFGNDQSQSTRDSTAGYDSKALGGTFGIDNMVGETLIGAAFTYARNDVDGSSHFNGQEGKTRTWDVAFYGSTPLSADKNTYVNYQIGGGIMDTSTRREFYGIDCCDRVVASGNYDTKFARASINLNHRVDLTKQTSFTPSAGLTYTYMDEDAYTENGAGDLKLHVKSNQTDQALATLAGRFDFYPTDGVRLYASALAGYDMINEQVDLKANFVNLVDSAFTTKGIDQSPWIGNARAGMSVNVGDVELNAGYGYTYRSDFDNHTATLRALYSF